MYTYSTSIQFVHIDLYQDFGISYLKTQETYEVAKVRL